MPKISPSLKTTPSSLTETEASKILNKELILLRNKSKLLRAATIKKNLKSDWQSSKEESESSKLEEAVKLKWVKSKIELLMPFAPLKLLFLKELFPEEVSLSYMLQKAYKLWLKTHH